MSYHPVLQDVICKKIFLIRDQQVMLSHDLADFYCVDTMVLNKSVKRNIARFPEDFMFQLTQTEYDVLLSQIVIANSLKKSRFLPYAFTEQGISMLSGILHSERAVKINIEIMRAFVGFRKYLYSHKELSEKLEKLSKRVDTHDKVMKDLIEQMRRMINKPDVPRRQIGFRYEENEVAKPKGKQRLT